jgi:hypothetical protein
MSQLSGRSSVTLVPIISSGKLSDLRRRIGFLCHAIRLACLVYAGWILFQIVHYWSDAEQVRRSQGAMLSVTLEPIAPWQLLSGFAVHFSIWCLTACACLCAWKLFSQYLNGQIFTIAATRWLSFLGWLGTTAQLADILTRPLISMIVSAHMPAGQRVIGLAVHPHDLLILLFLSSLIALAHIFRVATEIAEDHAQIV